MAVQGVVVAAAMVSQANQVFWVCQETTLVPLMQWIGCRQSRQMEPMAVEAAAVAVVVPAVARIAVRWVPVSFAGPVEAAVAAAVVVLVAPWGARVRRVALPLVWCFERVS